MKRNLNGSEKAEAGRRTLSALFELCREAKESGGTDAHYFTSNSITTAMGPDAKGDFGRIGDVNDVYTALYEFLFGDKKGLVERAEIHSIGHAYRINPERADEAIQIVSI